MKLSPKFILAFLLLMLSFSVSGNAMNFSTCIFSDSLVNYQNYLLTAINALLWMGSLLAMIASVLCLFLT